MGFFSKKAIIRDYERGEISSVADTCFQVLLFFQSFILFKDFRGLFGCLRFLIDVGNAYINDAVFWPVPLAMNKYISLLIIVGWFFVGIFGLVWCWVDEWFISDCWRRECFNAEICQLFFDFIVLESDQSTNLSC